MEKITCLNLTQFYLDEDEVEESNGASIKSEKYPCVGSIIAIIRRPEVKKEGRSYKKAAILLETYGYFTVLKDTPEAVAYLREFFILPPSFDKAL